MPPHRPSLSLLLFAFLLTGAHASPTLHKASTLPNLKPLPLVSGGRMRITPSPSPFGANDYTSQWPGSYFRAAFIGPTVYFRVGTSHEILHVLVDGQPLPPLVQPEPGPWQVEGLSNARHEIGLFVATESQDSPNTFGGFA
ncbi:MAG TPA: hypothetical protein VHE33_16995, partial [Acidobacteriaceae bacterium]|nr:hypothetical protein [Acidobacteriaceae bacterium]